MHWYDAIRSSPIQKAHRTTREGFLVFRTADGHGIIETGARQPAYRVIPPDHRELDGFLDWEPAIPSQEERLAAVREKVQKRHPWKGRP